MENNVDKYNINIYRCYQNEYIFVHLQALPLDGPPRSFKL